MSDDQPRCARIAAELDEPLAGTAPVVSGWVAIEHPGPWTSAAPSSAELGVAAEALALDGVRLQLIRPVRHVHAGGGPAGPLDRAATVLLAHAGVRPEDRWLRRLALDRSDPLGALTEIDPAVTLSPEPPPIGDAVEHDVWLLCAHARRDACCALHGRPVAQALDAAGAEVWETTHTGGHRFAATGVLLPDGLSLGRLDSVDAGWLTAALADGALPTELLRGRCALPRPAQAAEAALRSYLAVEGRDDVQVTDTVLAGDGTSAQVELLAEGTSWSATVAIGQARRPRAVSDDAEPSTPTTHTVLTLVPT